MSELTKCWLQQAITGIETIRDDMPFGLDEDEQKTLAALKMALSVLDAQEKPVAWCQHGLSPVFTANKSEADYWVSRGWGVTPLYTTPPAASEPVSKSYTLPDGWKLVPIEPNWSMLNAAINFHEGEAFLPASLYKAMLAAAPAPGGVDGDQS